jgi:hypothetical protein
MSVSPHVSELVCRISGCTAPVEVESFFPEGWVPECKTHGQQTLKQNWVADCFRQRRYGESTSY